MNDSDFEELFERALSSGQTPEELCPGDPMSCMRLAALLAAHQAQQHFQADSQKNRSAAAIGAGARLGPFVLEELIGRGGMGAVFRAQRSDGQYEQKVAIKLLNRELAGALLVDRFLRERQILAGLNHPHIVRLLDGGVIDSGQPWLAMELIEGQPLLGYAAPLTQDARLRLFLQICEAVEYAHQNSVIHRDLKPANVLVDKRGDVKLLDFGTAGISEQAPSSDFTLPWLTPGYASPEQLRSDRGSVLSDIYSLGLILFELCTGQPAFSETDVSRAFERAFRNCGLPPSGLHRDLDTIIRKAAHSMAGERYRSVSALKEDVQRFLAREPILARPQTIRYRAAQFARRRPFVTSALLAAALFAACVGAYILHEDQRLRRELTINSKLLDFTTAILTNASPASYSTGGTNRPKSVTVAEALQRASDLLPRSGLDPAAEAPLRYWVANLQLEIQDTPGFLKHARALRALADNPERRALADHADCEAATVQADWRGANRFCQAALAYLDTHRSADLPWRGSVLFYLAEAAHRGGDNVRAEALAHEAYLWSERHFGARQGLTMTALAQWGATLRLLGRYAEAEKAVEDLLAIQRTFAKPPIEMAESLQLLGLIRGSKPDRAGETEAFEEAERVIALYQPGSVLCSPIHRYVLAARARNRHDSAAASGMQQVLARCTLTNDFDRHLAHVAYAETLLNTGDLGDAEQEARLALSFARASAPRGSGYQCFAERILASTLIRRGRNREEARELLLASRKEYLQVYGSAANQSVIRIDQELAKLARSAE